MSNLITNFSYLRDLNLASILVRFILSGVCGGIIGTERGKKLRAAGLRTHLLVCIGSACVMMVAQYITTYLDPSSDMARLGSQVISGIGFLGVGTIVVTGQYQIKGLTTAAGLWASACMGLAIGIGFYEGAVIMCAILYTVLELVNRLDDRYLKTYSRIKLYIELSSKGHLSTVIKLAKKDNWQVEEIKELNQNYLCNTAIMTLTNSDPLEEGTHLLSLIKISEGIIYAEKL